MASRRIPGAVSPANAVFSPDGQWIAYVEARRRLVKLPLEGGTPIALADVPDAGGLDWSPDGELIVGAGVDEGLEGLSRISADGGTLRLFTRVDTAQGELSHQGPVVINGGAGVVFSIRKGGEGFEIGAASLRDDRPHIALELAGRPLGVLDGQLVYQRGSVLWAVAFDAERFRVTGTPIQLQDGIRTQGGPGGRSAFLTRTGGMSYLTGDADRRLVWVDRSGAARAAIDGHRDYLHVALSPDDRRVALTIATGSDRDVWILDFAAGTLSPLTSVGTARNPMWTPDGRHIVFGSTHGGGRAAFWSQAADGGDPPTLAATPQHNPWITHISPDGRYIVFSAISEGTFNLETVSLDSMSAPTVLESSPTAAETWGRFSPDGRWIAFGSDESGRMEVYIRASTPGGGRVPVSVNGGRRPVWSRDGRRLYYWQDRQLVEAVVTTTPRPQVISRTTLFSGSFGDDFDVAADGRFLMVESERFGVSLVAVPGWRAELRRLTGR